MLTITVPEREFFDESKGMYLRSVRKEIHLEHSLAAIAEWESKWCVPFLSKTKKTNEQLLDYIRCMAMESVDELTLLSLTSENFSQISDYINSSQTATTFTNSKQARRSSELTTAELIYYWMISYGIPMECDKWHLNRLLTLIQVFQVKSQPSKKMPTSAVYSQNRALNAARRKALHSSG